MIKRKANVKSAKREQKKRRETEGVFPTEDKRGMIMKIKGIQE
jgi:hypothetical protein